MNKRFTQVKETVSTLSTLRKAVILGTMLVAIGGPIIGVVVTFGPTVLGMLTTFSGASEAMNEFQQQREYRSKLRDADKTIKALQAENSRLQAQKQKVVTEIRTITVEVDRDVAELENITGVEIQAHPDSGTVILEGLAKPIPDSSPAKQNLAACKTALDGATKLAYDESVKLDLQISLLNVANREVDNLKSQLSEVQDKFNAAELRVKQLRKRKFRHGPGVGLQFLNPVNGFGIRVQPSFGYYLIWGR